MFHVKMDPKASGAVQVRSRYCEIVQPQPWLDTGVVLVNSFLNRQRPAPTNKRLNLAKKVLACRLQNTYPYLSSQHVKDREVYGRTSTLS